VSVSSGLIVSFTRERVAKVIGCRVTKIRRHHCVVSVGSRVHVIMLAKPTLLSHSITFYTGMYRFTVHIGQYFGDSDTASVEIQDIGGIEP